MLREIVYLSNRKLVQDFGYRPGRLFRWVKNAKATIKAGSGLELALEAAPPAGRVRRQHLLRVADASIKKLRKSGRHAVPFTDNVYGGQWINFAAPMAWTTIRDAAVFLDVAERSEVYPSGGKLRLLLHGTAVHMVGHRSVPHTPLEELSEQASEQLTARYLNPIPAECWASPINHFLQLIEWSAKADAEELAHHNGRFNMQLSAASLDEMIPLVEHRVNLPHTAAWVGGYARVTAVVPETDERTIIFATPLYVEHVAVPSPQGRLVEVGR